MNTPAEWGALEWGAGEWGALVTEIGEPPVEPPVACPPALANVLVGDYDQGYVRRTFAGDEDDDGEPVTWILLSRPAHAGNPSDRGYFRRLTIKVTDIDEAGQGILCRTIFGPIVTSTPRIIERTLTAPSFVGLGAGTLLYNSELDLDMALGLIAPNCRAILAGYGKIRIRALEYHLRPKPLTQPTVYS